MFRSPVQSPFQSPFPTEGAAAVATYAEVLRDDYNASEVWPLVDIASGTTIDAFINSDRDGTLQGWDLQNAAGPVTGTLAPYSDGANDFGNIYTSNGSTGFADIWDGNLGGVFGWFYLVSSYASFDVFVRFGTDNDRRIYILVNKSTGQFIFGRDTASDQRVEISGSETGLLDKWISLALTWNVSGDALKAYVNGSPIGSGSGLVSWSSALNSSRQTLGAFDTSPALVLLGYLCYSTVIFGATWSDGDILGMHNAASTAGPD